MVSEAGVTRNRIAGYAANAFGMVLGSKAMVQVAQSGFALDQGFGSQRTGAEIDPPRATTSSMSDLTAAIAGGGGYADQTQMTAGHGSSSMMALIAKDHH